jgi:short-subunit dehydrogenase
MDEGSLMPAEECARLILKAIEKKRRTIVMTFTGKRAVFLNRFFPKLADKLVYKYFFKNGELKK